jgi:hypothetical protein
MGEIEQLRKEVNELRERLAKLEQRGQVLPGLPYSPPMWTVPMQYVPVEVPHGTPPGVWCQKEGA